MSVSKPVVVDANILFSALLRDESRFSRIILGSDRSFFICESTIVEVFKHKERILQFSKLSEPEVIRLFYLLLRHLVVVREQLITPEVRAEAYKLCAEIDETDTPHVALTMHLDGVLWSGDKALKGGLRRNGFDRFFELD
jgi:predicted nucleic acid-binding protein